MIKDVKGNNIKLVLWFKTQMRIKLECSELTALKLNYMMQSVFKFLHVFKFCF